MEINNDINEIVYMKRDIKSHRIYEKHPNLMFGIIILVRGLLFFFGCFSDVYWVYWMVLVIIIVPITIWYIKNNEKTNLTKSSAFIVRDGIIYYIRLGYTLDYQQSGIPFGLKKVAIAEENMKKTKHIQEIRECENTFSRALTEVLNSNSLPNGVVKFCQMEDCRLEKETKQWVWLSYYNCYTHNQRVTQKFRNVYDFSFIRR